MQENSQLTVLVVDPNPGIRANLQNMLNQSGISRIESAMNAGTAIKALGRKSYDIILCEYDLGDSATSGSGGGQGTGSGDAAGGRGAFCHDPGARGGAGVRDSRCRPRRRRRPNHRRRSRRGSRNRLKR